MSKNIKVQLWPPFRRQNTTITQRTSGDTINSTGNLTFATGKYIASGGTNTNTLTLNANDTAFITFTTAETDTCAISGAAIDNCIIGASTAVAITGTTITANTGIVPDANDGAYLGQAGTAFSDLFLAEGGVINWDSGDVTLTQAGDILTLAGGDLAVTGKVAITSTAVASGGYALQLTTTSTSTADATACTGIYNALTSSAIIVGTSPYAFTGSYSGVTKTGADTNNSSGLVYAYQGVASQTGSTDVGTRSTYGGYFSATGDANGTSTTYGIYTTATGADTNWAAYLNGAVYVGGDMTFVAGGAIRSGVTNGNTLLIGSNDTTFITITSNATDTCALASSVTATTQSAGDNSTKIATTAYVDAAVGTVNSFAEILALSNITGANNIVVSTAQGINTALVDDNYFTIGAVDNDDNAAYEVARAQGAADPYFSAGGTQQFKFYNSGTASFAGAATGDAFIDISPTLTGNAATNTYAVNISPVGITIPTGTTAIAASLYVAEPIFTETGVLTLGANVYIDAAPTEGGTNYSLYVVGTSYLNGAITAPGGITGNVTGDCSGSSGTCTGNAGTVTNATLSTALTVNTGTLTLTAAAANNSVLTIGAGAVSVSGANTGDNAANSSTMYIGTTQHALNRASAAETLAGITLTTPDIGTPSAGVLTSCTGLTGTLALTANSRVTMALPVTDAHCTGPTIGTIQSGYSSAIGDLVFFGTGGKWLEVDADAVATCNGMMGIALEAKTDTQAMIVALPGSFVHIDAWNLTANNTYYAGETLGAIQNTIPTGADAIIRVVGFAIDADTLYFMPSSDQQSTVA